MSSGLSGYTFKCCIVLLLEFHGPASRNRSLVTLRFPIVWIGLIILIDQLIPLKEHLQHGLISAQFLCLFILFNVVWQCSADGPAHVNSLQVSRFDF